jgi:hypothetical protein
MKGGKKMKDIKLRKLVLVIEDTLREMGQDVKSPLRKVAAIAVIENPYAGKFVEDLSILVDSGVELGEILAKRAVGALELAPNQVVKGYGKGAIVGSFGEIEHGAAIMHPKLGKPFRAAVGGGKSIIPSSVKKGAPGARIDVPLQDKDDEWHFDYLDAMEVGVDGAPGPDEIVVALVVTNCGRPLARVAKTKL